MSFSTGAYVQVNVIQANGNVRALAELTTPGSFRSELDAFGDEAIVLLSGFSSSFTTTSQHALYLASEHDIPVLVYYWAAQETFLSYTTAKSQQNIAHAAEGLVRFLEVAFGNRQVTVSNGGENAFAELSTPADFRAEVNAFDAEAIVYLSGFSSSFLLTSQHAVYLASQHDTPVLVNFWTAQESCLGYGTAKTGHASAGLLGFLDVAFLNHQMTSVTVLSHSMGGRPLLKTIDSPQLSQMLLPPLKFLMVAADAPQSNAKRILDNSPICNRENTWLIASKRDLALQGSRTMPCQGDIGPKWVTFQVSCCSSGSFKTISASRATVADDDDANHSYLYSSAALKTLMLRIAKDQTVNQVFDERGSIYYLYSNGIKVGWRAVKRYHFLHCIKRD